MVEMKYTKFIFGEAKRKIFGDPKPTAVKIPVYVEPQKKVEKPQESNFELPSFGGPSSIVGIAVAMVTMVMVFTIFGSISTSLNTSMLSPAVSNLMSLIPLVMFGALAIGAVMALLTVMR
jgi:hypothetical protein